MENPLRACPGSINQKHIDMTKGSLFWANAKGKLGQMVISRRNGEEITRAYQPNVKNPKSYAQMRQRVRFANAVKFYKHAKANFFPFAFEDKKKNESYFNAFMRHNTALGCITSKEQTDGYFPALSPNWMLTQGSFRVVGVEWKQDEDNSYPFLSELDQLSADSTIADVSKAFIDKYDAQVGDYITFVCVSSDATSKTGQAQFPAVWALNQIQINTADNTKMSAVSNAFSTIQNVDSYLGFGYVAEGAAGAAVIISRVEKGQTVKVSDSVLINNETAKNIIEGLELEDTILLNLQTWGATTSDAILKGSISANSAKSTVIASVLVSPQISTAKAPGSTIDMTGADSTQTLTVKGSNFAGSVVTTNDGTFELSNIVVSNDQITATITNTDMTGKWEGSVLVNGAVVVTLKKANS